MSRYIDADKLRAEFDYDSGTYCAAWEFIDKPSDIQFLIDEQPTADVVEVVRCADCKWWDNEGDAERCAHKHGGMWAKPNGYCSYGEGKEDLI